MDGILPPRPLLVASDFLRAQLPSPPDLGLGWVFLERLPLNLRISAQSGSRVNGVCTQTHMHTQVCTCIHMHTFAHTHALGEGSAS